MIESDRDREIAEFYTDAGRALDLFTRITNYVDKIAPLTIASALKSIHC